MNNEPKAIALTAKQAKIADMNLVTIVGAAAIGLALLFAAGFAQASVLHDTAHDMRHAMSFPCH